MTKLQALRTAAIEAGVKPAKADALVAYAATRSAEDVRLAFIALKYKGGAPVNCGRCHKPSARRRRRCLVCHLLVCVGCWDQTYDRCKEHR